MCGCKGCVKARGVGVYVMDFAGGNCRLSYSVTRGLGGDTCRIRIFAGYSELSSRGVGGSASRGFEGAACVSRGVSS